MKKLIFLLTILSITALFYPQDKLSAQTAYTTMTLTPNNDTLSNGDTLLAKGTITKSGDAAIYLFVQRVSGTLAGGATLWVSADDITYHPFSATDTLALVNGSVFTFNGITGLGKTWTITNNPWNYYQIRVITTGTVVARVRSARTVLRRGPGY